MGLFLPSLPRTDRPCPRRFSLLCCGQSGPVSAAQGCQRCSAGNPRRGWRWHPSAQRPLPPPPAHQNPPNRRRFAAGVAARPLLSRLGHPPHLAAHRDSGAGQHPRQEQHCGTGQGRAWSPARCWRAQLSRGQTASARRRRDCWLGSAPVQRAGVCPCAQLTARGLIPSKRTSHHRAHNCTARENK